MGEKLKLIDHARCGDILLEIFEYESLSGSSDPSIAQELYYAQQTGIRLRKVKATLYSDRTTLITESGALHYSKGNIVVDNKIGGVSGAIEKFFNKKLNNEKFFRPSYRGVGEVHLEPSFNHFYLFVLEDDALVVDRGMFYASAGNLSVSFAPVDSVSSALLGNEGLIQTVIKGTGVVAVEIPVPFSELVAVELNDETLKVDGDFALMRHGDVKASVSLGNKGLFKSWTSGEKLVETFKGTGTVFLAPTNDVYRDLSDRLKSNRINTGDVIDHQNRYETN